MEGDELRAEMGGIPLDEIIQPGNSELEYVLEFYNCDELLPLANRIIWLSNLKEIFGAIPNDISVDYEETLLLSVLLDERNKKVAYENWQMREESRSNNVGLDNAIKTRG